MDQHFTRLVFFCFFELSRGDRPGGRRSSNSKTSFADWQNTADLCVFIFVDFVSFFVHSLTQSAKEKKKHQMQTLRRALSKTGLVKPMATTSTEELFEIFTSNNTPTGFLVPRSQVHKTGLYHRSVHVWLFDKEGKVLIQKRGPTKKVFPSTIRKSPPASSALPSLFSSPSTQKHSTIPVVIPHYTSFIPQSPHPSS